MAPLSSAEEKVINIMIGGLGLDIYPDRLNLALEEVASEFPSDAWCVFCGRIFQKPTSVCKKWPRPIFKRQRSASSPSRRIAPPYALILRYMATLAAGAPDAAIAG
jgi:hypothetical protein